MHVDLIKLYGSMELAPLVGLADAIVDLVSTGNTLKANDLVAVEDIMPITLAAHRQSRRAEAQARAMQPLIEALARGRAGERGPAHPSRRRDRRRRSSCAVLDDGATRLRSRARVA